ncbi:MAG TPA: hypothetical protein DCZ01_07935 [Elusimicrobia bacterium]|nr:MAG: hypothetical protein A2X37_06090 [Elusimicrobia bacterium GWA2_66_18]OGR68560.1 MAG: hypothetical protein A2X40_12445 [Elusimicrobia bacterium GWC2_65_9]HAZ08434.1 hypothetical protein [Elusimicrobiota bacterium]
MLSFPLQKGRLHTRIAPGYSTIDMNDADMSGWALAASANYGLGDHWGVGFMVGHSDLKGKSPMSGFGNLVPPSAPASTRNKYDAQSHDSKGQGTVVMGNFIWDHWTGEGFRLPVYMGAGFMDITETRNDPVLGAKNGGTLSGGALALGAAPSFGFGKFRAAVFLMTIMCLDAGTEYVSDYDPSTGAEIRRYSGPGLGDADSILLPLGTELTYMPWGLSLGYVAPIDGASTYTLSWTRRWGAGF